MKSSLVLVFIILILFLGLNNIYPSSLFDIKEFTYKQITITINNANFGVASLANYPSGEIVWAVARADDLATDTNYKIYFSAANNINSPPFWISENIADDGIAQFIGGASMPKLAALPKNLSARYIIAHCTNNQSNKNITVDLVIWRNSPSYLYKISNVVIADGESTGSLAINNYGEIISAGTRTPTLTNNATTIIQLRAGSPYSATNYLYKTGTINSASIGNVFSTTNFNQYLPLPFYGGGRWYWNVLASEAQSGAKTIPIAFIYKEIPNN